MIFESCSEIRSYFSDYIDNACEAPTIRSIRYHLAHCIPCTEELDRTRALQGMLRSLPRRQVPSGLALRLRVQMSRGLHRNALQRIAVRLENIFRPVWLPSLAGLVVAVVCIGLMMAQGVPRSSNIPDVPLGFVTPPRIQELAPMNFDMGDGPLVLVTYVNSRGEVTSYKVISGQHSPQLLRNLDRMMYFSLFRPATTFGRPTNGQVVLSLRHIVVRG